MRFEFFIATRYLRAKRRQAVIGVITGISIAGVAAGVASLVVALAINNGFRQDLQNRLLGSTSHINLLRIESDGIKEWRPLMERLSKQPHVVGSGACDLRAGIDLAGPAGPWRCLERHDPSVRAQGQRSAGHGEDWFDGSAGREPRHEKRRPCGAGSSTRPGGSGDPPPRRPLASGASAPDYREISRRSELGARARGVDAAHRARQRHRRRSGATLNSVVLVTSPQGELTPFGLVPKYSRFRVVGIFNSGFFDYDSSWAFTRLCDTQNLEGLGDQITVLEFKVDDIYQARQISQELEQAAGKGFMTTNWMEQNKALFRALRLEKLVTFITIGLIVFVAALNILISLTMMVMEKTRDIAVLMSMGTRKSQVRRLFITQGLLIGVIGTAIGLALGYASPGREATTTCCRWRLKFIRSTMYRLRREPLMARGRFGCHRDFPDRHAVSILVGGADSSRRSSSLRVTLGQVCDHGHVVFIENWA